jgi:hypothetical protein
MDAYIHWMVLACLWRKRHYVALRSTGMMSMKVWVKKADNVEDALYGPGRWKKEPYEIPWWMVMYYFWYDTEGYEACLYSNDREGETGITMTWRFMMHYDWWKSAKLSFVPGCSDPWSHCI